MSPAVEVVFVWIPIAASITLVVWFAVRCLGEGLSLKQLLRGKSWPSVAFAVGPEGGWTDEECETFLQSGFRAVQLGHSTLRTETAATVAAALLRYELFPGN